MGEENDTETTRGEARRVRDEEETAVKEDMSKPDEERDKASKRRRGDD